MQPVKDKRALVLVYEKGRVVYASFVRSVFDNIEEDFRNTRGKRSFNQLEIPVGKFIIYIKQGFIFRETVIYTKFLNSFSIKVRKDGKEVEEDGIGLTEFVFGH